MYDKENLKKQKQSIVDVMENYAPRISLSSKQLPEIKQWKIGKTYKVVLELEQKGMHEGSDKTISSDFEVKSVAIAD